MTDARQGRGERDDHIAEVIPLRRPALSVDQPTIDLGGLVHRAGATLSEVVGMAEEHGLAVPEQVRLAAVLLDARLTAAAAIPPEVPASAPPPGTFETTQDGLQWADDLDGAVAALVELWRCHLNRREFLGAVGAMAVTSDAALRWLIAPPDVPLLTGKECESVRSEIHQLRPLWVQRGEAPGFFFTLGLNSYIDLVQPPDGIEYYSDVPRHNAILQEHFGWLLERVRQCIEQQTGAPARFVDKFALPGLHTYFSPLDSLLRRHLLSTSTSSIGSSIGTTSPMLTSAGQFPLHCRYGCL